MTDYAHFMQKALDQAGRALSAGEFPVGCVIEYKGQIIATGSRTGTTRNHFNEVDHAEIIALRRLYNKKIDKGRATIFCTLEPCLMCLGAVAISQVGKIVYGYEDVMGGAAGCDLTKLTPLYSKQKILIVPNILRQESLALFKTYFVNPKNDYLKGSLLAEYTLKQNLKTR